VIEIRNWTDGTVINTRQLPYSLAALQSLRVYNGSVGDITNGSCPVLSSCFVNLFAITGCATAGVNTLWLGSLKDAPLTPANITAVLTQDQARTNSNRLPKAFLESDAGRSCSQSQAPSPSVLASSDSDPSVYSSRRLLQAAVNVTSASLTVSSTAAAPYVWLETVIPGRFSDNGFAILPGEAVMVDFTAWAPFDPQQLIQGLKIRSLRDTYTRG